ncbi:hypothetical protein [Micromonospora sp. WMMD998]|uniref:hypothetical protein n=1 Tax=Micromonospora sp. WMMD998 TaxID=3016092 RepID=UPI00249C3321|nr:hypothetical protein [Micromonospora sp. WMMD998]WFE40246.1 hypothetical protein O7619_18090 [Micromonospora sp. WMMD998]
MTGDDDNRHCPVRPLWLCRLDGAPWPCPQARAALLRDYDGDAVSLAVYLAGMLHDAVGDLYALNPHDVPAPAVLWDRFLAWLGRSRRASP